jgi:hypothetical protein
MASPVASARASADIHPIDLFPTLVLFAVTLMRHRGIAVPPRERRHAVPIVGDLRVEYWTDEVVHRPVRVARLLDPRSPLAPDRVPPLRDVCLLWMASGGFTLSGVERLEERGQCVDYAQAWLVGAA